MYMKWGFAVLYYFETVLLGNCTGKIIHVPSQKKCFRKAKEIILTCTNSKEQVFWTGNA